MTTIKNTQSLSAEEIFDLLKKEFSDYVDAALNANMSIEFAHVADIINLTFPEVIEGIAFSLTVSDESIEVTDYTADNDYNTELLEQHLMEFLQQKAG